MLSFISPNAFDVAIARALQTVGFNSRPTFERSPFTSNVKISVIEENFRKVKFSNSDNFNIFFYDGPHHYEDHYDAIKLVLPALSKKFILIVDDWNWSQVRKGTLNAIKDTNINIISQLDIRTTKDDSSSLITGKYSEWHQGCSFFVLNK